MNSRSIWKGNLAYLVGGNIPVSIHTATRDNDYHFHQLCKNGHRINYLKFCEVENRALEESEITKAFEVSKDQHIIITKEELEKIKLNSNKEINIKEYVATKDINAIFIEKSYYIIPDVKNAGVPTAFVLLSKALQKNDKVGIATWTYRDKEHVAIIRSYKGGLLMQTLFYNDEIKNLKEIDKSDKRKIKIPTDTLALCDQLIEAKSNGFHIKKYKDSYRIELGKLIDAKVKKQEYVELTDLTLIDSEQNKQTTTEPDIVKQLKDSLKPTDKDDGDSDKK